MFKLKALAGIAGCLFVGFALGWGTAKMAYRATPRGEVLVPADDATAILATEVTRLRAENVQLRKVPESSN